MKHKKDRCKKSRKFYFLNYKPAFKNFYNERDFEKKINKSSKTILKAGIHSMPLKKTNLILRRILENDDIVANNS